MAFYAGRMILEPRMENPTIVVITDRNDLDDQLFGTFARCHDLLRQSPVQAESRDDLREKLRVSAGSVVFTTIQKFMPDERGDRHPVLSDRQNIVVIADEARTAASTSSAPGSRTRARSRGASRSTCATRCRTPRTSGSRARQSS